MFAGKKLARQLTVCALLIIPACAVITAAWADARQVIKTNQIPKEDLLNPLGPMNPEVQMSLAIGLSGRNQAQRDQLIQSIYDPSSPNYRHYLTPQEYADQFGASQADYNALSAFFQRNGFKVTTSTNRLLLDIHGTVKMVEDTFHVTLIRYKHPNENREFFSPNGIPSIDEDIPLETVTGLDNFTKICPAWGCNPTFRKVHE